MSGRAYLWFLMTLVVAVTPSVGIAQAVSVVPPGHESLSPDHIGAHRAVWRLVGADGEEQGLAIRDVQRVEHLPGEPAIAVFFHMLLPQRSALDISYLHAQTLLPFARYLTGRTGMWVQFQSGSDVVATYTRRDGGDPFSIEAPVEHGRFNGGVIDLILAAMPLELGYSAQLPLLGATGNRSDLAGTILATVRGRQTLQRPDGTDVETWRVELERSAGSNQVMYMSREAPYMILREVLDGDGNVVQRWQLQEWGATRQ